MYENEQDEVEVVAFATAKEVDTIPDSVIVSEKRIEHIKCARVRDDIWVVHPGTRVGEKLSSTCPFHPKDLRVIDLTKECNTAKRDRDGEPVLLNELPDIARNNKPAFEQVSAFATWVAEFDNAAAERRAVNATASHASMVKDPFKMLPRIFLR